MGLLNAAQGGISVAVERQCVLLAALLLANAFFLTVWGTTPGKAVFGLHLETSKGGKPSFLDALRREWQVLLYGCGLLIPVCSQICQWISYRQCANGAVSRWDEESPLRYTVRDNKKLRYAAFAGNLCGNACCYALPDGVGLPHAPYGPAYRCGVCRQL